jgi:NTP pyrophosphatase (non-canonical NTP hydrolase)
MRVVKVQLPNDGKQEDVISNCDIFYGEIYIADNHHEAWAKEFNNVPMKEMSLIEEMAELTQVISKYYRNIDFTKKDGCIASITEEMAHVLISIRGLAWALGIHPEDIQAEIEKKYPAAYEKEEK